MRRDSAPCRTWKTAGKKDMRRDSSAPRRAGKETVGSGNMRRDSAPCRQGNAHMMNMTLMTEMLRHGEDGRCPGRKARKKMSFIQESVPRRNKGRMPST